MFTIRPYAPDDESGLLAAWRGSMWSDPIDALTWRSRYLLDPLFDPGTCLVAESDGVVAGFVLGMPPRVAGGDAWVVGFGVLPSFRRQGIANALFSRLRATIQAQGAVRLVIGPYVPGYVTPGVDETAYPEAIAFLQAIGGSVSSRPISMKASLTGYRAASDVAPTAERLAGEGVVVREAVAGDIVPLLGFIRVHFPHWADDAREVMTELFGRDPRHVTLHVAVGPKGIEGFAQSRSERFGPFGVDEAQRGKGVGAVLLDATLLAMRSRGYHSAWFLWTSDRAAALYERHGFREVRRFSLITLPETKDYQDEH